jgi:DNA-binding NarL/FixJ family response regulator
MGAHEYQFIIADTQFLALEALQKFLFDEFLIRVKRVVCNKHDLFSELENEPNAVLIVDHNQIDFDDLSEMLKLLQTYNAQKVIVLTNSLSIIELSELVASGIKVILFKTAGREEFKNAVESVLKGKKYYSGEVLDMLTEMRYDKGPLHGNISLTHAEIEIVRAIAEGFTTKQIAVNRYISYHTVMTHRKNIFRKLSVKNVSELVMYAIRNGIIDTAEYHI